MPRAAKFFSIPKTHSVSEPGPSIHPAVFDRDPHLCGCVFFHAVLFKPKRHGRIGSQAGDADGGNLLSGCVALQCVKFIGR